MAAAGFVSDLMLKSLIVGIFALIAAWGLHHASVATVTATRSPHADTGLTQTAAVAAATTGATSTTTRSPQSLSSSAQTRAILSASSQVQPDRPASDPIAPTSQQLATVDPPSDYVTSGDLIAEIGDLQSWVREYVAQATTTTAIVQIPQQVAAGGNYAAPFAAAQAINQLSNVTIANPTFTGLRASEIPDLSGQYLSLNGGAVVGTSTFPAIGIGTTSPGSIFSITGVANWTGATSTYYATGGINLAGGCFAINGACVGGSGSSSGIVSSGAQGQFAFYNAAGTTVSGTSTLFAASNGNIGIGTTTPGSTFSIAGIANWTTATSTYYGGGGINLAHGCFAINGTCVGALMVYPSAGIPISTGSAWTTSYATGTAGTQIPLMWANSGSYNLMIGTGSGGVTNATGSNNICFNASNLSCFYSLTTGSQNITIGQSTLFELTTGSHNIGFGNVLAAVVTGQQNIAMGENADNGADVSNTIAIGFNALQSNQRSELAAVGNMALESNTTGFGTAFGPSALADNTIGLDNDAFGADVLGDNVGGNYNTAVGDRALEGNISGNYDTAIGVGAGYSPNGTTTNANTTGSNNTYLGYQAAAGSATQYNYQTVLGAGAVGTCSNCVILGGIDDDVGIGTTSPYAPLSVWGPDAASSTLAFDVINSASTTVFSVFDGGNAELSGSLSQSSDQRLKTDVQSLDASSSLSLLEQLNPVSYLRIDQPGTGENLGFLAQQVEGVFPELVSTTSPTALTPDGTLTLNYTGLIAPIVSAIQDIASVSGDFEQKLIAWLANASNGIGNLFADNLHAQNELCVGSTCVTPTQFAAMVAATAQSSSQSEQGSDSPSGDQATSSPDTPPVIQVNGDNPATVDVGATYNDLGATITGPQTDLDLGIDASVDGGATTTPDQITIDTSQAGTHTILYCAADQSGLGSCATRTVNVVSALSNAATTTDATSTSD